MFDANVQEHVVQQSPGSDDPASLVGYIREAYGELRQTLQQWEVDRPAVTGALAKLDAAINDAEEQFTPIHTDTAATAVAEGRSI